MAKPKSRDLAALAALGAIGYKLSQNKSAQTAAPVEETRAARPESTETRLKSPAQSIADAQQKAPDSMSVREESLGTPGDIVATPVDKAPPPAAVKNPVTKKKPAASTNTSQTSANRSVPSKPTSSNTGKTQEELMAAYKPRYTPPMMAPKTTQGASPKPYMPKDVDNEYPGRPSYKKGGAVKKMASGGMTSGASRRGDGIASRGKTRGKIC